MTVFAFYLFFFKYFFSRHVFTVLWLSLFSDRLVSALRASRGKSSKYCSYRGSKSKGGGTEENGDECSRALKRAHVNPPPPTPPRSSVLCPMNGETRRRNIFHVLHAIMIHLSSSFPFSFKHFGFIRPPRTLARVIKCQLAIGERVRGGVSTATLCILL